MILVDGGFVARGQSPIANVLEVVRGSTGRQLGSWNTIAVTDCHGGFLGIKQSLLDNGRCPLVPLLNLRVEKPVLGSLHSSLRLHLVLREQILQALGRIQYLLAERPELILAADPGDGVECPGSLDLLAKLALVKSLLIPLVLTVLLHLQPRGVLPDGVLGSPLKPTVELGLTDIRARVVVVPVLPRIVVLGHSIVIQELSLLVARLGCRAIHHLLPGHGNFHVRPPSQDATLLRGWVRRSSSAGGGAWTSGTILGIPASVVLRLNPVLLGCSKGNTGL
mmetsp:Transcript_35675/g.85871  ORF Transcript_35675/g.85871 Transcript_35675/m.85871 type:complete len:279 (-) Transcript_35675:39-875(-)